MMAIFFIVLVALAFIHFLYEAVLAPSLRFELRLKLFALRDKIRKLKVDRGDIFSDPLFRDLQGAVNATLNRLNRIDLGLLKTAHDAFERDEKLRKFAEEKEAMLEACPLDEVRQLRQQHMWLVAQALIINSGGWVPYLIPVAIGAVGAGSAMAIIRKLFSLSENDIDRIAPSDRPAPA